jgi:hypothetical protein
VHIAQHSDDQTKLSIRGKKPDIALPYTPAFNVQPSAKLAASGVAKPRSTLIERALPGKT